MATEAVQKKEEGNKLFKEGKYEDALVLYTEAIKLNPSGGGETANYYKNRAACFLKLDKYTDAAKDCSSALDIVPNDPKALFRRCQALENMERYEDAYKDATALIRVDPKNPAIQPIMRRLNPIIQNKVEQHASTDNKVSQMFDLTFKNTSGDAEKRKQAANNLIVLAREPAGAEKIYQNNGIPMLLSLLDDKDEELQITAIRTLACLAKGNKERAKDVYDSLTLKKICLVMSNPREDISTAMAHVFQNIINSVTHLDEIKKERDIWEAERKAETGPKKRPFPFPFEKFDEAAVNFVDEIFPALIKGIRSSKVSAFGRDNAIELAIKFVTRTEGCGWPRKFIGQDGILAALEVAGTIPEHKTLPITLNTRMHASLLLAKVYDDLLSDKERELYREAVNSYFDDMFGDDIYESKVEAIMALAALLQGPFDVGNSILAREGVVEMILAMANSEDAVHIKYAVEALVHSASKKERCSGVIKQATPILKQLYQSQNDTVKVRALVGLCKLGSFGGSDASAKTFADGSTLTLAKACRKFLKNPTKDADLRKWAAEGLAYLTLDADVKDELIKDTDAIKSLIDLAKIPDKGVLYPVAQILVNVTNSYDKPDIEPELIELAKFAKQHVPESHEKDKEEFVKMRVDELVKNGVVTALVALSKTDSHSSRELLARVYLAVCMDQENRGLVVQQGGAKALIPLALEGNDVGKAIASQALAKIAITTNPEFAFPGQRACEVVRPLLQLLHIDKTALQNFEALMALTNLAAMSDTVRKRIVKEKGFPKIEHYTFEEHDLLKRAAVECVCNLVMCEDVVEMFKGENDRVKLLLLYSGEDDEKLQRAAAGALAILSQEKEICHKVTTCTEHWFEILQMLSAHEMPDIQYRGVFILANIIHTDKDLAQKLVDSTMLELLMAISKIEDPARAMSKSCADEALKQAMEWGCIQPANRK